jgi:hypothetical protein
MDIGKSILTALVAASLSALDVAAQGYDSNRTAAGAMSRASADASGVTSILPVGLLTYTYYPSAGVYYASPTGMYYYKHDDSWIGTSVPPAGVTLGKGRSVQLRGAK